MGLFHQSAGGLVVRWRLEDLFGLEPITDREKMGIPNPGLFEFRPQFFIVGRTRQDMNFMAVVHQELV